MCRIGALTGSSTVLLAALCFLTAWSEPRAAAAEAHVIDIQGMPGDVVRIDLPAFCLEYGKPGPAEHTTLSVQPKTAGETVDRLLYIGRVLRSDPDARALFLSRDPLYADLLWHAHLAQWLCESASVAKEIRKCPLGAPPYKLYRDLSAEAIGADFVDGAIQQAIWAANCDLTAQRLLDDELRDIEQPAERIALLVEFRLILPYVCMVLNEAGVTKSWHIPSDGWPLPAEDVVSDAQIDVLLGLFPTASLVRAGDACLTASKLRGAETYYLCALRHSFHPTEVRYLARQLLHLYDQAGYGLTQAREAARELAGTGEDMAVPGLALLPSDPISETLTAARCAFLVGDPQRCLEATQPILVGSAPLWARWKALQLSAYAALALGNPEEARSKLAQLVEMSQQSSLGLREIFAVDVTTTEAELILRRLDVQQHFDTLYQAALSDLQADDVVGAVAALVQAAELLPGSRSVHLLLANLYARLGDYGAEARERMRAQAET